MAQWSEAKEKGNAAYKAGDFQGAIGLFGQAIDADKENASGQQHIFFSNRSAAYLALGRANDALTDAEKCLKLSPGFVKGYSRKAAALYRLGRFVEAAETYDQGLGIDPSNTDMRKGAADARKAAEENKPPSKAEALEKLKVLAAKNRPQAVLFPSRLLILLFTVLYLLPLPWRRLSTASYRCAALASLLNYLFVLYSSHGMPKFNTEYLARVMMDPAGQYLFLAMLLFSSKPYVMGLGPVVLTEGIHAVWFLGQALYIIQPPLARAMEAQLTRVGAAFTQDPAFGTFSSQKKWDVLYRRVPEYAIMMEIATGLTLLVELLTPYRNIVTFFLFWQYLQMRYMLDQRDNGVRRAFKQLDTAIMGVVSHPSCPAMIGKGYGFVKAYLSKAVQVPEPGAPRAGPKCTIM